MAYQFKEGAEAAQRLANTLADWAKLAETLSSCNDLEAAEAGLRQRVAVLEIERVDAQKAVEDAKAEAERIVEKAANAANLALAMAHGQAGVVITKAQVEADEMREKARVEVENAADQCRQHQAVAAQAIDKVAEARSELESLEQRIAAAKDQIKALLGAGE